MITAALTGQLDSVEYKKHPVFNLDVPTTCPGVPDGVLDPRGTWPDAGEVRRAGDEAGRDVRRELQDVRERRRAVGEGRWPEGLEP